MCSPTIAKSPLEHYWHQGAFGPSGAIRTLGPVNPNHVRYQLRYTRIFDFLHDTMRRKKKQVFRVCGQCCGQARFCRNFSTGKFPPQATVPRTSGLSLLGEWIGHLSSQSWRATNCAIPGYSIFLHDTMRRRKKQVFRVCGQCCGQGRFCGGIFRRGISATGYCPKDFRAFTFRGMDRSSILPNRY